MNATVNPQIIIEISRCHDCGRYWGLESGFNGICPRCASRRLQQAFEDRDSFERSNNSLRGALSRVKNHK